MDSTGQPVPTTVTHLLQRRADDGAIGLRFEERSWTWAEGRVAPVATERYRTTGLLPTASPSGAPSPPSGPDLRQHALF